MKLYVYCTFHYNKFTNIVYICKNVKNVFIYPNYLG